MLKKKEVEGKNTPMRAEFFNIFLGQLVLLKYFFGEGTAQLEVFYYFLKPIRP